jgi:hypothetical protein
MERHHRLASFYGSNPNQAIEGIPAQRWAEISSDHRLNTAIGPLLMLWG